MRRDQQRALYAYECVETVVREHSNQFDDYKRAVHSMGAEIIRSGLCAAVSDMQRRGSGEAARGGGSNQTGTSLLQSHIAAAEVLPFGERPSANTFPSAVRALDTANYMLVTREMLSLIGWFRRAVQACEPVKSGEES